MRKLLQAAGLATIVALATSFAAPNPASASQTCTAACQSASLTCTVSTGTCSSSPGTVTCCGQTHTCAAINAWDTCLNNCIHGFRAFLSCTGPKCGEGSPEIQQNCIQNCGTAPKISFSC